MYYPNKISTIAKILLAGFIAIFVNILVATAQHTPDANGIIYVKEGSAGNGSSWTNATGNLQNAIDADDVQEVWVAKGTYQPPSGQSFSMKPGVVIYGGFPDTNDNAGMADRNWATYLTKLQGNGTCVVINADNALTSADILDGFTITGGNEGGIISAKSSPSYVNLVITGNSATFGGGVYIVSAAPRLTNVLISGNGAIYGGGMVNFSSPILTNVTISGNSAFYSNGSEWYNSATATPVIRNSIIYGYGVDGQLTDVQNSLVQNQTNAAYTDALNNNLPTATDPLFASSVGENYTL